MEAPIIYEDYPSAKLYAGMKVSGIDFVTSVPCVNLQGLLELVSSDPAVTYLPVTREEEGVGICAGAWMGGRRAAVLMQNSGLGNCINALASLNNLYRIPLLLIISHRGTEGETIAAQMPMGKLTEPLLRTMDIPFWRPESPAQGELYVVEAWKTAERDGTPVAVLLDLSYWKGGKG